MLVTVNINEKYVLFKVVTKRMEIFSNVIHSNWNGKGSKTPASDRAVNLTKWQQLCPVGRKPPSSQCGAGPAHSNQQPLEKESWKHTHTHTHTHTRTHRDNSQPESVKERGATPTPSGPRQPKDILQEGKESRKRAEGGGVGGSPRPFWFCAAQLEQIFVQINLQFFKRKRKIVNG